MEYIGNGGLPIGLVPDVSYERIELEMQPGDRLLIYSDGITEATLKTGRMLDQSGLADLAGQCTAARGTEFLDDLYWRLSQLTRDGVMLEDDVSAALLEFDGLPDDQTA